MALEKRVSVQDYIRKMVGGESLPRGFTWVAPTPESLGIKKTFSTVNSPVYSLNREAQCDSIALEAKQEIDFKMAKLQIPSSGTASNLV